MQSLDTVSENVAKVAALFPHCVTEQIGKDGEPELAIDFDKLRIELGDKIAEGTRERYQFTWPQKRLALDLANERTNMTLRPMREGSVDFDNTENLYIEGDNLEVLKVLRETYRGKVKMIYIDPPYNTGKDFVYKDKRFLTKEQMEKLEGKFDEYGNVLLPNTDANGRFHTDWLNFMYPRLKVARDLLTDDGVIFISIDDSEAKNLKAVCDELFGEQNFIAQVVWERAFSPINLKKHFSVSHDYILCYAKSIEYAVCKGLMRTEETNARYSNPDNDPRGPWQSDNSTVGPAVPEKVYELVSTSGKIFLPPSGRCWLYSKARFQEMIADNRIWFGANGNNMPRVKRFLSEVKEGLTPMSIWKHEDVGHSQDASQKLKKLFDDKSFFEYPKPIGLIERCIQLYSDRDSIVLDFFSGSGTTAHAVMKLNAEDGGNRKFIMVQLAEPTPEDSEARRAGYKTICEIGEERIRRAGANIKEDGGANAKTLDTGFRILKLDTSNMKNVFYNPSDFSSQALDDAVDNVKNDRLGEDLLFQIMLEHKIPLSSKIKELDLNGHIAYSVEGVKLLTTFDRAVDEGTIEELAKMKPEHFVMREPEEREGVNPDNLIDNCEQIFKLYSPNTDFSIL